jgi:glutathione S-transferase
MYTLYYSPDACSLATQVILHELDQSVEIKNVQQVENFNAINPVGAVPVLVDSNSVLTEGAAIVLHLLNKHENTLLAATGNEYQQGVENIMFANATMHPAYSRLFFIAQHISDEKAKQSAFVTAAQSIAYLWQVVEQKLAAQENNASFLGGCFLGGELPSAADIMLTVYSRWGASFPVEIPLGPRVQKMIEGVLARPNFQRALAAEKS